MPKRVFDEITNWIEGVITSASSDAIPPTAAPRARNSILKTLGPQTARIASRPGFTVENATPITGAPALYGFQFKKSNGQKYTLLASSTGRLDKLNADGTTTVINATALTSGHVPNFEVANDLCFITTDVDQKKFDGTNFTKFGITRPAAPTAAVAAGGTMAAGVWDVGLTYFNSATGHESSLSDLTPVTIVAASGNYKINVSWSAPSDAQVTHVRVYVRQQALGQNIYRATAGATPAADATYGGYAPATTSTVLDITAAQYSAFITLAPTTIQNEPPPAGTQYPCWHGNRLFVADAGNLYYSDIRNNTSLPEAFDAVNRVQPVSPKDGDSIIGLAAFKETLIIFKRFSVWRLDGLDPNSWVVSNISYDHGCTSAQSIVSAAGVLYWWSASGPVALDSPGSLPTEIGKRFIADSVASAVLNQTQFALVCAGYDEPNQLLLWAVPGAGETRNTLLIPWNYRALRFTAEYWNPFDVNSLFTVEDAERLEVLYTGGYAGQVFRFGDVTSDGVPADVTASGTVVSSTNTTLTVTASSLGSSLTDRYVYAVSLDRQTVQRRRISSNTATVITVTSAWSTNPDTTWTYVIGGVDFEIDTPWINGPTPFIKRRFEFFFLEGGSEDSNVLIDVDLFLSMDDVSARRNFRIDVGNPGGVYDDAIGTYAATAGIYDTTRYGSPTVIFEKKRVARTGRAWRGRIRHLSASRSLTLVRLAMQSVMMGINR